MIEHIIVHRLLTRVGVRADPVASRVALARTLSLTTVLCIPVQLIQKLTKSKVKNLILQLELRKPEGRIRSKQYCMHTHRPPQGNIINNNRTVHTSTKVYTRHRSPYTMRCTRPAAPKSKASSFRRTIGQQRPAAPAARRIGPTHLSASIIHIMSSIHSN